MKLLNKFVFKNLNRLEKISTAAYLLAAASILIIFYELEPPPSDIVMGLSVTLTFLYFLLKRELPQLDLPSIFAFSFLIFNLFQLYFYRNSQAYFWVAVTTFLILAFISLKFLSGKFSVRVLFKAYLVAALISVVAMIVPFIQLYSYGVLTDQIFLGRSRGFFKDPNVAGPFLIPALIYFIDEFIERPKLWKLIVTCLLTVGIFFSLSRGALIAAGVALIGYLILKRGKVLVKKNYFGVLTIFLVTTSLMIFSYGPFQELAGQRFRFIQGYDKTARSVSWESGLSGFAANPSGSGPGSFESGVVADQRSMVVNVINSLQVSDEKKKELLHDLDTKGVVSVGQSVGVYITPSAHDTYLRVLRENGIVGIIIFIGFLVSVIWASRFLLTNTELLTPVNLALITSWLGILVNSFVIDTLHWRLFWYLPALLLASLELRRAKS